MLCQAGRSCYWRAKQERSQRLEDRPCSATGEAVGGGGSLCTCVASLQLLSCKLLSTTAASTQIICTPTYVIPKITTGDPGRHSGQPMPFLLRQTSRTALLSSRPKCRLLRLHILHRITPVQFRFCILDYLSTQVILFGTVCEIFPFHSTFYLANFLRCSLLICHMSCYPLIKEELLLSGGM
jgi:hypothetical protein